MRLQHSLQYLKIKPVLAALMPDYTLLLCAPRDRQDQLAVPFGTILYLPAQGGSSTYSVTPFTTQLSLPSLCVVCVSAMPCQNAPLQHPGSFPGVVLVWSRSSRKKFHPLPYLIQALEGLACPRVVQSICAVFPNCSCGHWL